MKIDRQSCLSILIFILSYALLLCICVHFRGYYKHVAVHCIGLAIPVLIILLAKNKAVKFCRTANFFLVPATTCVLMVVFCWESWGKYNVPEINRSFSYTMGKTLVIVPHQDDEINCLGGVLGEIQNNGETYILFSTNGNYTERINEAVNAAAQYGIPKENILCLGYGACVGRKNKNIPPPSAWGKPYTHMYNMLPNEIASNPNNNTKTWSLPGILGITSGVTYTRNNFKRDLRSIIETITPDTIICIDYDIHPDHRALSLLFEEVICELLKERKTYTPFILKSFAYSTAWLSPLDFYSDNLPSTKNTWNAPYMLETNCYNWADRLRLPVAKEALTRVLSGNIIRDSFMENDSQLGNSPGMENAIVNSDRVFWWRPTGNLLYNATISGNGVNVSHLNDFKLYDSKSIGDYSTKPPIDHGWIMPEESAHIEIALDIPSIVSEIRLYDQIRLDNQIKELTITLSNGKTLNVTDLPVNGSAKIIKTNCNEIIHGFTLHITKAVGIDAGLAEIEAYSETPTSPINVVKLVDVNDDFIYDHTVEDSGKLSFTIYSWPTHDISSYKVYLTKNGEKHELTTDNIAKCFNVCLKQGEEAVIEVEGANHEILDKARVHNPEKWKRTIRRIQQKLDSVMKDYSWTAQKRFYKRLLHFYCNKLFH